MSYPTLEQYNEAFQHPQLAIVDPQLKKGKIATTGLGLPHALCGGFALTYKVTTGSSKYAVRCFHKKSNSLPARYKAISNQLKQLHSSYFIDFEFQPQGIRVNGKAYPIVKMAWATGETLGEFLERNYSIKGSLQQLDSAFHSIASYLEGENIAHGDIQPGNVMVANGGRSLQLIDYDGIFVDELKDLGSSEIGHRNFQHPKRSSGSWNPHLDRFSFISINLALRALKNHPELWDKTQSDGDTILFKANDFAEPSKSTTFSYLFASPQLTKDAKNFAAICNGPYEKIPSLADFLAQKNIPQIILPISQATSISPSKYISAYPVLDAMDYAECLKHVGDRIELIGKIVEVKHGITRYKKPYIFINFAHWKGEAVKISIWSKGLSTLKKSPDQNWVGKWVGVVGLMEPPYRNRRYNYSHLSISITQANQLHVITESEAKFRLFDTDTRTVDVKLERSNKSILDEIRESNIPCQEPIARRHCATPNQAVLQEMKEKQAASNQTTRPVQPQVAPQKAKDKSSGCLWAIVVLVISIFFALFFN